MTERASLVAARGLTDAEDRLLSADPPLADLQQRCGGTIPGTLAVPELLDLVKQGRNMGLRLAREFSAFDGESRVTGFVRINPLSGEDDGAVCELLVENWQRDPMSPDDEREAIARIDSIDRATAELNARLDANQRVQIVESDAPDLDALVRTMRSKPGQLWSEHVKLDGITHQQPLHWRLLDGARCTVEGSYRHWRIRLLPIGGASTVPLGFELLFVADHPLTPSESIEAANHSGSDTSKVGEALTPALRQPISRIIANAETIRSRLAGPLRKEYSDYAADIASAGQHLATLLDDLVDLEVVEAPEFTTAEEKVDLVDAARRAAGILGVKARDKSIDIDLPDESARLYATGEFRRVLQILLNLISNAISYSPVESSISIHQGEANGGEVNLVIADNGPGMSEEQQRRVFNKFERLGRDGDGGSGLGLYISQRLAHAMGGKLAIESEEGQGTRFTLGLPAAD